MNRAEFTTFLEEALANTSRFCRNGAVSYICMDWRHMGELLDAGQRAFDAFLNLCVWAKTNGGMGSFYRSQHELVFVFRKGSPDTVFTFNLKDPSAMLLVQRFPIQGEDIVYVTEAPLARWARLISQILPGSVTQAFNTAGRLSN